MDLKNALSISASIAGASSIIPGLQFMAPVAMGLEMANDFIPSGKPNMAYIYGKDVTPNYTRDKIDVPQKMPRINPSQYSNYFPSATIDKGNISMDNRNSMVTSGYSNNSTILNPTQYTNQYIYGQKGYNELVNPESGANSYNLPPPSINTNQFNNINPNMSSTSPTDTTSTLSPKPFNNRNALLSRANEIRSTLNPYTKKLTTENLLKKYMNEDNAKIDKYVHDANVYNSIGQGVTALSSLVSIFNELNKKPSQMMDNPQYSTVNLDSNQSANINYAENLTNNSKNAQLRMLLDLGIDPMLSNTIVNASTNTQMLGAYANAENARQNINLQQEQINSNIQSQANQSLAQTKMFNIQKQVTENQLASKNIGDSLTTLASSIIGFGQGNLGNRAMGQYMKNQLTTF
jgi:hypothetical protein